MTVIEMLRPDGTAAKDWPEDFGDENGCYQCRCVLCGEPFLGYKRRVVCRQCADAALAESIRKHPQ